MDHTKTYFPSDSKTNQDLSSSNLPCRLQLAGHEESNMVVKWVGSLFDHACATDAELMNLNG